VFAFSVLPAMAAVRLSRSVPQTLVLAALLGGVAGFVGYLCAYLWHLPVGASQALVAVALVLLAEVARRVRPGT
jgi:zinc transport system permease protein